MARPNVTTFQASEANVGHAGAADLLNRLQQMILAAFQFLFSQPLGLGQVLVKGVALTTAATSVRHGLGRPVQGWIVVRADAQATVIDDGGTDPTTINLTASADATVSILFF